MSYASTVRESGFSQLAEIDGDKLTLLNTAGGCLNGIFSTAPYIDPPFELASDLREKACMECDRVCNATTLASICQSDMAQDEGGNKWVCLLREDNPAVFTVKLWFAKFVTGTDT